MCEDGPSIQRIRRVFSLRVFRGEAMNADFEKIYDVFYAKIYNYVYYRLLNREAAEDVVGAVFLKAMENIHHFDGKRACIATWLFRIAANAVNDYFRRSKRAVYVSLEDVELSAGDAAGDQALDDEDLEKLRVCLNTLDDRARTVIALRYWGGFSYAEIAEQTGLTEKNVSVVLSRAMTKLKEFWKVHCSE
jgi:RNA polymerase sigma-70 factor (ECF subfamily)